MEIKDIYSVNYMKDHFNYVGTLRNEKRFNIGDNVFFTMMGRDLFRGRIIGIELPPIDNPDYLYKIQIPKEIINKELYGKYGGFDTDEAFKKVVLTCNRIFNTIQEAKESAIENLHRMAELQREEIENYFKQFE